MMDQYSQHRLKVAATEPEHVVRKAEFDVVIDELEATVEHLQTEIVGSRAALESLINSVG